MSVEAGSKEAKAAHFAITHDINACIFLITKCHIYRIVERLLNI